MGKAYALLEVIERPTGDFFYDADATSHNELLAAFSIPLADQTESEAGDKVAASEGRLASSLASVNATDTFSYRSFDMIKRVQSGVQLLIIIDLR